MPKFGTKIWVFLTKHALFGYFWPRILKIILSYLKSGPSNLSNYKILRKKITPKSETKNALFGYFWARILKNYCHV